MDNDPHGLTRPLLVRPREWHVLSAGRRRGGRCRQGDRAYARTLASAITASPDASRPCPLTCIAVRLARRHAPGWAVRSAAIAIAHVAVTRIRTIRSGRWRAGLSGGVRCVLGPLRPHLAEPDHRCRPLEAAQGGLRLSVDCQSSSAALLAHLHERVRQTDLDERLPRDAESASLVVDLTRQVDREVDVDALDVPAQRAPLLRSMCADMSSPASCRASRCAAESVSVLAVGFFFFFACLPDGNDAHPTHDLW